MRVKLRKFAAAQRPIELSPAVNGWDSVRRRNASRHRRLNGLLGAQIDGSCVLLVLALF